MGSTESLISPEVETPANNGANPENENSGESPEGQMQTNINLEVKNTSPEENSVALSEWGTILRGGWRRYMKRCWRRMAESSLPAKTGQNPAFHQNAPSNVPSGRIPANRVVSVCVWNYHRVFSDTCVISVEFLTIPWVIDVVFRQNDSKRRLCLKDVIESMGSDILGKQTSVPYLICSASLISLFNSYVEAILLQ